MREIVLILKYRFISFLKSSFETRWSTVFRELASVFIFAGFALSTFISSNYATSFLMTQAKIGLFLFHRTLSMLLFILFVLVSLGNMIVAYSTFYRGREVEFLFTTPLKPVKIYFVKFLDNFFYSSSTMFIFIASILLGYGSYFRRPFGFYIFSIFGVMLPFMLMAASVSIILLMLILKLSKRFGIKKVVVAVGFLYALMVFIYFKSNNPMRLFNEVMQYYPFIDQYLAQLDPSFVVYLPNHWISEIFYFSIVGDTVRVLKYFLILIFATAGVFMLSFGVAKMLYFDTFFVVAELRGRKTRGYVSGPFSFFKSSILKPQLEVILKRDLKLFVREPSQWVHFLVMLVLVGIFVFSLLRMRFYRNEPELLTLAYMAIFSFDVFLTASIVIRFVYPSVSLEGMSFWSVRSAPVKLSKIYWYKFLVSFSFLLLISLIIGYASSFPFGRDWRLVVLTLSSAFFVTLTYVSLGLGMGSYFANYAERSPVRIASSRGATLTLLIGLVLISIFGGMIYIPVRKFFASVVLSISLFDFAMFKNAIFIVSVVSLLISFFFTVVGLRGLRRDF